MKHEVFVLGGQKIDLRDGREARGNFEREKRERIGKASRERIEKETIRQFEEKEGLKEKNIYTIQQCIAWKHSSIWLENIRRKQERCSSIWLHICRNEI